MTPPSPPVHRPGGFCVVRSRFMEIIKREPAYEGADKITQSIGIVFASDKGSPFYHEDSAKYLDDLEASYDDADQKFPFHFVVDQYGNIYEGLGWKKFSPYIPKRGTVSGSMFNRTNSHVILYLGAGEDFTVEAARACRYLIEEHLRLFNFATCVLARDVIQNSHSGGFEVRGKLTLAGWVKAGCPPFDDTVRDEDTVTYDISNFTVGDAKVLVDSLRDVDILVELYESEKEGKDRITLLNHINERIALLTPEEEDLPPFSDSENS